MSTSHRNHASFRFPASSRIFLCLAIITLLFGVALPAQAAGTLAGTTISNQAYANYKDANNNQMAQVFSNTVTTIVSQVGGVELVPNALTTAAAPNTTTKFLSQIFNRGNASDSYTFTYTVLGDFTPTVEFFYDLPTPNPHVLDAGDTPILPTGGVYTTPVAASVEDDVDLFIKATVPNGVTNGQTATIRVTAVSKFDGTKTSVGNYVITVAAAAFVVQKTHTPEKPVPGQPLTYTLTISNVGTIDGTAALASDPLPVNLDFIPGSIQLNGVAKTDALDGDGADFNLTNPNTLFVNVGTVVAGGKSVITFQAKVKDGIAANSTITNIAHVAYSSGGVPVTVDSNGETLFVGALPNVDLTSTVNAANANPGDKVTYPINVINKGNSNDTINLSFTSAQAIPFTFYLDVNGDGKQDSGDTLLTDSNGDGVIDVGIVPPGTTIPVIAVGIVPAGITDGTIDTAVFTGTSVSNPAIKDTVSMTTTITAPQLALVKSVSPVGNQPPGTTLTYTVIATNNGKGAATQIVVTDPIPAHTTYVAGSIKTGATINLLTPHTDANDSDNARFDSVSKTIIIGGPTMSLGAGGTLAIQFQVKID